jgi:hypothetical protein
MDIQSNFWTTTLRDCPAGSLIKVRDNDAASIAFVLKQLPDEDLAVVGLFPIGGAQSRRPYRLPIDRDEHVMSYGTDWTLSLEESGLEYPGNSAQSGATAGAVVVSENYKWMYFAPSGSEPEGRGTMVNLPDFTMSSPGSFRNGVTVFKWSIWLPGGNRPFFSFDASAA